MKYVAMKMIGKIIRIKKATHLRTVSIPLIFTIQLIKRHKAKIIPSIVEINSKSASVGVP
jgi:hypothetical protein